MPICVESEIGRLRRVLVHRPGPEIDRVVPDMMEQLLFDDILYGEEARREHDGFCAVMQTAGVETLDAEALLAEVLEGAEAVPCGGADRLVQEREQWTDGANAFALAPGVVLLYRRNRRTLEELVARGRAGPKERAP